MKPSVWMRGWAPALLLFAATAGPARATAGAPPVWTPDDLLQAEEITEWAVARDGQLAVWVLAEVRKLEGEEKRVSNLELGRLATGERLALTRGNDRVSHPAFSPDGRYVGFLSTRELPADKKGEGGKKDDDKSAPQLWLIAVGGGEAFPVTTLDRPVIAFGWVDASTLLLAAQESPTAWENEREEKKDTTRVVDDAAHEPPVRLFTVTLEGKVQRLTTNDDWVDSLAVSPDGRWAVVTAQQSLSYEFDQLSPPQTRLVEVASGREERLFADDVLLPQAVRWAPDASGFYFGNPYSRDPLYRTATITELWYFDLARHAAEKVDVGWERGLGGDFAPAPSGVIALLADGVRFRPALLERRAGGWARRELSGTHVSQLDGWKLAADGRTVVYTASSAVTPRQLYTAKLEGPVLRGERQLSDLNSGWAAKPTGKSEILRWTGARGETVEGILHYPLDWREGERRPLVLDIHGGPAGVDRDTWSQSWGSPKLLWRQRGAFVFEVNYHGSSDYGLDWVESIAGHYYELEIPDIETGVDTLIARGLVDPERLGVSGWSNGGILTAELITRTRRYRAASVGAADVEWLSDWANVDFGASFDNYYFGGPPWEKTEVYLEKSPFLRLAAVTTPTIIHTGTEDRNVPPHQSWSLFRALQQIGKAPVRLLLYPGEPHGLQTIAHRRRKLEADLAWFDQHLFATQKPENEALKKGSPLDTLLERSRAATSGGRVGREEAGLLVPETVAFEGLEVGRFEVTRAQLAVFDPGYPVAAGSENLPAVGIGFEKARAYAAWLAEKTGRAFRLPTAAEAEKLAVAGGKGGNTLDRWAGYTVNPDDAERLGGLIAGLGEGGLLLPVGSLAGQDGVFDLDGNAAEWAVGADGKGLPAGPSADRPADPRGRATASPGCTGLRVVVGE